MGEVGDGVAVEDAVVGVGDGLEERVLDHADAAVAEIELADVDGVERGREGLRPFVEQVGGGHRVVLQPEVADIHLTVDDALDQVIVVVAAVGGEPDVALGALDVTAPGEHRHHRGDVAVADVVLLAVGAEQNARLGIGAARCGRGEDEVGVVDVGAVVALGQRERHHLTVVEVGGGLALGDLVVALPDRAETQDGHLLGVPVRQPVEPEDLRQRRVARRVPALVRITVGISGRGQERREQLFLADELEELRGPHRTAILGQQLRLALGLEPLDGGLQQPPRLGIEMLGVVGGRVEQQAGRTRHAR